MKRVIYLVLVTILFVSTYTGCKKFKSATPAEILCLTPKMASLYEQLPVVDYGNIILLDGDILRFENEEHYLKTYDELCELYEKWTILFIEKYGELPEDSLDIIIEQEGFDDNMPLLFFERQYGFEGKNLLYE